MRITRTQRLNVDAFDRWGICPRVLRDVSSRDLSVELLGLALPSPLMLAPVAMIGLSAPDGHGDLAAARAAARTGVPMIASTLSVDPLELVAAELGETPGFFQLYLPSDRELAASLVTRAEAAGFKAIVLTVDVAVGGWRPRDLATGNALYGRGLTYANFFADPVFRARLRQPPEENLAAALEEVGRASGNAALSWDDLVWLRSATKLPLGLKGVLHPEDVRKAIDLGVHAVYCSTHGGRQANFGVAALDLLPAVVNAAGDVPVIFDSGVRGGDHLVKALALGANAVAVGRPTLTAPRSAGKTESCMS